MILLVIILLIINYAGALYLNMVLAKWPALHCKPISYVPGVGLIVTIVVVGSVLIEFPLAVVEFIKLTCHKVTHSFKVRKLNKARK